MKQNIKIRFINHEDIIYPNTVVNGLVKNIAHNKTYYDDSNLKAVLIVILQIV